MVIQPVKVYEMTRVEELTGYTPEQLVAVAVIGAVVIAAVGGFAYQAGRTDQAAADSERWSKCHEMRVSSPTYPAGRVALICPLKEEA